MSKQINFDFYDPLQGEGRVVTNSPWDEENDAMFIDPASFVVDDNLEMERGSVYPHEMCTHRYSSFFKKEGFDYQGDATLTIKDPSCSQAEKAAYLCGEVGVSFDGNEELSFERTNHIQPSDLEGDGKYHLRVANPNLHYNPSATKDAPWGGSSKSYKPGIRSLFYDNKKVVIKKGKTTKTPRTKPKKVQKKGNTSGSKKARRHSFKTLRVGRQELYVSTRSIDLSKFLEIENVRLDNRFGWAKKPHSSGNLSWWESRDGILFFDRRPKEVKKGSVFFALDLDSPRVKEVRLVDLKNREFSASREEFSHMASGKKGGFLILVLFRPGEQIIVNFDGVDYYLENNGRVEII